MPRYEHHRGDTQELPTYIVACWMKIWGRQAVRAGVSHGCGRPAGEVLFIDEAYSLANDTEQDGCGKKFTAIVDEAAPE